MRRGFLVALVTLLAAPACGDLLDPAAAVVYGDKIPIEDVQRKLDAYVESAGFEQLAAQGDAGALKREFEQGRLSDLIMRAVLTPAAEERGIEITDEIVRERIDELVDAEFGGIVADYEEALKEQGLTKAQFEEIMYDRLLSDSLRADVVADAEPDEDDLRAYYDEHEADFRTTRAQHILVEDQDLATQLAARLQTASEERVEALFAKLAREHSTDPSAKRTGGDLGFQPPGTFVEPFENALVQLDEGEVSEPVQSEFGWHVIRVSARRTASFEEVRAQIQSQLTGSAQDDAWNEFLDGLFEEADVEVNPRYGVFDEELGRVVDPDAGDIPGAEEAEPSPEQSVPAIPVPPPPPPG
jgi:parvulin-like peptidyl-prolyl isomerase